MLHAVGLFYTNGVNSTIEFGCVVNCIAHCVSIDCGCLGLGVLLSYHWI